MSDYNPDATKCICGGSGWTPGIPDDEPCPYHGQRVKVTAAMRADWYAEQGLQALREALQSFKLAGCPKTADRVRLAISSARGAVNHADHRARQARMEANR